MKVNWQNNTISYRYNNPLNIMEKRQNNAAAPEVNNGHISLKRMITEANREQTKNNSQAYAVGNNIISNSLSYSDQLKAQRESAKDASLEKKKLKYQFKDISSQIIRSKTSQSARKAVSSARREILRLNKEKASGEYDSEEIEAAIAHAKAMERVAKKKVRHLEEEEMLKAAGGPCADYEIEQEEKLKEDNLNEENLSEEELGEEGLEEKNIEENLSVEDELMSAEELAALREELMDISSDFMGDMADLTSELMDEMEEGMRDMLEDMGFGELSDSLSAAKGDMDPADFKMMKIKHRNKEMKEIVKADADYLKAIFKYFEKMKSGGAGITTGGSGGSSFASTPSTSISSSSTSAVNMSMSGLSATGISSMPGIFGMSGSSVIDVSL